MARKISLALAVALGAALFWFVGTRSTRDERRPSAVDGDELPAAPVDAPAEHEPPHDPETAKAAQVPEEPEPAQAPEPTAAEAQPSDPHDMPDIPRPERMGPVDELEQRFRTEPRSSSAAELEKQITDVFRAGDLPPELMKSVLCRRTVCRIETRWTPARAEAFLGALMRVVTGSGPDGTGPSEVFDTDVAVSPHDDGDDNGVIAVDVYLRLLQPAEPSR